MSQNTQIAAYLQPRPLKEHEHQLISLIRQNLSSDFAGHVLDIGCASGNLIGALATAFPRAHYVGFDISRELIELARRNIPQAEFYVADALTFRPPHPFEIIVASGVLSIFEDFRQPMDAWLSWLAPRGQLYIFGRFNSRDIDTIIRFRNNYRGTDWEGGLTAYSVQTVSRYLSARRWRHEFIRFHLSIELPESEDPIRTYTIRCQNGQRLVVNGANVIAEHYFLRVWATGTRRKRI